MLHFVLANGNSGSIGYSGDVSAAKDVRAETSADLDSSDNEGGEEDEDEEGEEGESAQDFLGEEGPRRRGKGKGKDGKVKEVASRKRERKAEEHRPSKTAKKDVNAKKKGKAFEISYQKHKGDDKTEDLSTTKHVLNRKKFILGDRQSAQARTIYVKGSGQKVAYSYDGIVLRRESSEEGGKAFEYVVGANYGIPLFMAIAKIYGREGVKSAVKLIMNDDDDTEELSSDEEEGEGEEMD